MPAGLRQSFKWIKLFEVVYEPILTSTVYKKIQKGLILTICLLYSGNPAMWYKETETTTATYDIQLDQLIQTTKIKKKK